MDNLARYRAFRLIDRMKSPCPDCTPITAASGDIDIHGLAFPLGEPSGDGRMFSADADIRWDLEMESVPIIWDVQDSDHTGVTIGTLDTIFNSGGAIEVSGRLFKSDNEEQQALVDRVTDLIAENAIGWSVMVDDEEAELTIKETPIEETRDGNTVIRISRDSEMYVVTSARIRHLALVDTPAFPNARPILGPMPALAAAAAVATYPARHFDRWESDTPVPLTVTPEGHVYGHAAGDGCFRNGSNKCKKYQPDPDKKLRNFHTGTTTLDNGAVIRTGVLTAANLHASINMTLAEQRQHHENSSMVWAKVVAWQDRNNRLCVSGSVVPGLDETMLAQVAGLPLSVEQWPVIGFAGLPLVGIHTVTTPAFVV